MGTVPTPSQFMAQTSAALVLSPEENTVYKAAPFPPGIRDVAGLCSDLQHPVKGFPLEVSIP